MAKKSAAPVLLIRNLADGPRDYPLKDGSSIYLPPRGKPAHWAEISEDAFSEALKRAEEKGAIQVKQVEASTDIPTTEVTG
ncbi:MAG: hypothetical protein IJU98_08080 [Synergistaceae bacterium]|nr:hypothetical protein [Synergistaceae bacterium]